MSALQNRFPVDDIFPDLLAAFAKSNIAILSAPPGAGKTTRVPLALLKSGILNDRRLLMLEPRRLAARLAAEFMAEQIGEQAGETVGYRIRGEHRIGPATRIEILTEGILTRLLQENPDLPNVGIIIFDEFHERSIHADLGLAFTLDVQKHLRTDMKILIMSATIDDTALSSFLGNAPIIESKGSLFPVETHFAKFRSDKPIAARIADTVARAMEHREGDILVFLPGWREIRQCEEALIGLHLPDNIIIHLLHGESPPSVQAATLATTPAGKRKIILSTNVAETSLTIEGVRIVVDSGIVRAAHFDPRTGMSGLVTVPVSRASANQRRGRAGRVAPGVCHRLWTEADHLQLPEFSKPEIRTADLAPLALELIRWGSPNGENLLFLDPPPPTNLQRAQSLLHDLEAVDETGRLTTIGQAMGKLPVHPRLSHMIIRGDELGLGNMACTLAALLEERDLFAGKKDNDVDLDSRWLELQSGRGAVHERVRTQARRLQQLIGTSPHRSDETKLGELLALAYPERIAQRRGKDTTDFIMASGTSATLPHGSPLARSEFLAIADAEKSGTQTKILLATRLEKDTVLELFKNRIAQVDEIRWSSAEESVIARRVKKLGAIIFSEQPIDDDDDRIADAMVEGIRDLGLEVLPWDKESLSFRERSEWLRRKGLGGDGWPDLRNEFLVKTLDQWLRPFLKGVRQRKHLSRLNLDQILKVAYSFKQLEYLSEFAPGFLKLPTGSRAFIDYSSGEMPVIAVRLQEVFGQVETPRIGGGPVVVQLLSPARRPLAVTQDLGSFWRNVYPEIRNQMRSKYPKHFWPEEPLNAKPTSKTKRYKQTDQ